MPRVVKVDGEIPMSVHDALQVFASPVRVSLVRYWITSPGPQKDAATALGVARTSVSINARALIAVGVVYEDVSDDRRSHTYRVDRDRLRELHKALGAFADGR